MTYTGYITPPNRLSTMRTYLFYDIETTGLNKAFDQILQFAAIRTDIRLNEIDRHQVLVKLRPDIIYSPEALITTRISIRQALSDGLCEYEAVRKIHALINEWETISIGYNTLGFDDEFLRFSFFRNLLPPYTHQYERGCYRMDMLPITILYWLFKKDIIHFPIVNGKPSLKLENISAANQLTTGQAHDAMVDVQATVELARRFLKEADMFNYVADHFVKTVDMSRIEKLPETFTSEAGTHHLGLMYGSEFGSSLLYQVPVLSMGMSNAYPNQTLWLRLDYPELSSSTADLAESAWVYRKKFGEPGIILPPLDRYWKYLDDDRQSMVESNITFLKSHPDIFKHLVMHHRNFRYPEIPNLDADAALYQMGFMSSEDRNVCQKFHQAAPAEKTDFIDKFSCPHLQEIVRRLLYRNFPQHIPPALAHQLALYKSRLNSVSEKDDFVDYKGHKKTTPQDALSRIDALMEENTLDIEQKELLYELKQYVRKQFQPNENTIAALA